MINMKLLREVRREYRKREARNRDKLRRSPLGVKAAAIMTDSRTKQRCKEAV